jgi:hypothetical protein
MNLTKKEALERYSEVKVPFTGYYKYVFTFYGRAPDGAEIEIRVGGASGDIYRMSVTPQTTASINLGHPFSITKDGYTLYEETDY